jgi:hypothetical protein
VILYNLGKVVAYIEKILFLYHGIENIINHIKVKFTMICIIIAKIISITLTIPYKWDKFWMYINTLISLGFYIIVLCIYLYTLTFK